MSLFSHSYTCFFFVNIHHSEKYLKLPIDCDLLFRNINKPYNVIFIISKLNLSFIPYRSYEDKNYLRPRTFRPNNNRRYQNTFTLFGQKQNNRHSNGQRLIVYVRLHFVLYGGIIGEWMWWYKSTGNGNIMEHNINSEKKKIWRTLNPYPTNVENRVSS